MIRPFEVVGLDTAAFPMWAGDRIGTSRLLGKHIA